MISDIKKESFCYAETPLSLYGTLYRNEAVDTCGVLLYFHGGGLVYGNRDDLPNSHIESMCKSGYIIISFDYRLAPASKLPDILEDFNTAVNWYLKNRTVLLGKPYKYFLWGRSAGAYLCLLSGFTNYKEAPVGIVSYYGYTFLINHWFNTPNKHYLGFPTVSCDLVSSLSDEICTSASLETRYSLYVHARQTGRWLPLFFEGKEKNFFSPYSFRLERDFANFPSTFLVHGFNDPDVPFEESKELSKLLPKTTTFFVPANDHDFDRDEESAITKSLLESTISFLDLSLKKDACN